MSIKLGNQWSLSGTGAVAYSQPVPTGGANAAQFEVTVYALTASETLTIKLQESIDRENWTSRDLGPASDQTATAVGAKNLDPVTEIGGAFVRLQFSLSAGTAVFGGSLFLSKQ